MRRLFWMTLGATVGVLAVRRATRAVEALTPPALARSLSEAVSELAHAVGEFAVDVRQGMAEREAELRADLGLDDAGLDGRDLAGRDLAGPDLDRRDLDGVGLGAAPHPALGAGPARLELPGRHPDRIPLPAPRTGRHA